MIGTPGIFLTRRFSSLSSSPSQYGQCRRKPVVVQGSLDSNHFKLMFILTGSKDVDFVSLQSVNNAVISIDTFMSTLQAFPSLISCDPQSNPIFGTQLFEFGHNAIGDDWNAFGIETVHHCRKHVKLLLDRVRQKIGIN